MVTKNADADKHNYSAYSIEFDSRSELSFTDGSIGKKSLSLEMTWAYLYILIMNVEIS